MPGSTAFSDTSDPVLSHLWVTILAGGVGSRFWPLSTPERPKQLLPLAGPQSLVSDAVDRALALVPEDRLRILAGSELVTRLRDALPGLPASTYAVEPSARGTAPVLAWAASLLAGLDPDAVMVSLHSDHHIEPVGAFVDVVHAAAELAAREDVLVTVGARPDRPETGYGYIQVGESIATGFEAGAFRVGSFHEKPDSATAAEYLAAGHLWNTGIFVWTAARFLEEIRRHAPEIGDHLQLLEDADPTAFFDAVPRISVDVAVMERSERVAVVPATFDWDDVGAWHSLFRTRPHDDADNAVVGDGHVVEGHGNVVFADDGPLVLFGVDDLVAVRTHGVTLVTTRERAPDLKSLLSRLPASVRDTP